MENQPAKGTPASNPRRKVRSKMQIFQEVYFPILALAICAFLHLLNTKDARPLLATVLALALGVGLSEFAVWQYELRSGLKLGADVSFLARLVMGLQESETCAGWFNGYTAPFISLDMTAEAQKEIAKQYEEPVAEEAAEAVASEEEGR